MISPASNRPGGMSISFSTLRAVTVLPEPDSPTTASVSPRSTVRSTPSTARTMPSSVLNQVFKLRISSKGPRAPSTGVAGARGSLEVDDRLAARSLIQITRRGSNASRSPSPMKLIVSTARKIADPGNSAQCGAICR